MHDLTLACIDMTLVGSLGRIGEKGLYNIFSAGGSQQCE